MRGIAQYKNQRIESASPARVLVMLFQKSIVEQLAAIDSIAASEKREASRHIHHARAIFLELISALDDKHAPELVANLRALYGWCIQELIQAERSYDPERIQGVLKVTRELLEGWSRAAELAGSQTP